MDPVVPLSIVLKLLRSLHRVLPLQLSPVLILLGSRRVLSSTLLNRGCGEETGLFGQFSVGSELLLADRVGIALAAVLVAFADGELKNTLNKRLTRLYKKPNPIQAQAQARNGYNPPFHAQA